MPMASGVACNAERDGQGKLLPLAGPAGKGAWDPCPEPYAPNAHLGPGGILGPHVLTFWASTQIQTPKPWWPVTGTSFIHSRRLCGAPSPGCSKQAGPRSPWGRKAHR